MTDGTGAFSGIAIKVARATQPGTHYVTAVGRRSGLAAQTAFVVQTDWAQYRFTQLRQGQNVFENTIGVSNVSRLQVDWTATTGDDVVSSPAVANGVVYVGSNDDKVYALDASTGAILWTATTGGVVDSSPAVANGVVYAASLDFKVYAYDVPGILKQVARPDPAALHPDDSFRPQK